jgi:hypothetical protein
MRKALKKAREKKDRMLDRVDDLFRGSSRNNTPEPPAPEFGGDPRPKNNSSKPTAPHIAWAGLKTLGGVLRGLGDMFGPLKSAVESISECVEVYEVRIQIGSVS